MASIDSVKIGDNRYQTSVPISSPLASTTATIANGESLSGEVDLVSGLVCGIQIPADWTAAGLSFQGSHDGTQWGELKPSGAALEIPAVAANDYVTINPQNFVGIRYLKVRSGTSAAAVSQGAERVLQLVKLP